MPLWPCWCGVRVGNGGVAGGNAYIAIEKERKRVREREREREREL